MFSTDKQREMWCMWISNVERRMQKELLKREVGPKKCVRDEWDELLDECKQKKVRGINEQSLIVKGWEEEGNLFDRAFKRMRRKSSSGHNSSRGKGSVSDSPAPTNGRWQSPKKKRRTRG